MKRLKLIIPLMTAVFALMLTGHSFAANVCYIGEDEATRVYYESVDAAVATFNGSGWRTVYVTQNTVWGGGTSAGVLGCIKSADAASPVTVTMSGNYRANTGSQIKFEAITIDLDGKYQLAISNGAQVTLSDKASLINGDGSFGAVLIGDWGGGGTLNLNSGCTVSGSASTTYGGAVVTLHSTSAGKLSLNGGKIVNNNSSESLCAVVAQNASNEITIGGDFSVENGTNGKNNAISLQNASQLKLANAFTGNVTVAYGSLGENFGTANEGASITTGTILNKSTGYPAVVKEGKLYWDYAAYRGTDEAANRHYSFADAVNSAKTGDTIYLVKDTEFSNYTNKDNIANKAITVNGNSHTLTMKQDFILYHGGSATLENVTVNMGKNKFLISTSTSSLTLNDKAHLTGGSGGNNVVGMESWGGSGGSFTMNEGSKITANNENIAAVWAHCKTFLTINGEISGNTNPYGAIYMEDKDSTLMLGSKAKISGNTNSSGDKRNVGINNANQLTISGSDSFSGEVGVFACEAATDKSFVGEGKEIGVSAVSLKKAAAVTWDVNESIVASVTEGKLKLIKKPTVEVTYDSGVYNDGATGVVRAMSTFSGVTDGTYLESVGTYFVKTTAPMEGTVPTEETKKYALTDKSVEDGKGLQVDLYGMDNLDAKVVAITWYKLAGVDEYVYTIGALETVDKDNSVAYTEI